MCCCHISRTWSWEANAHPLTPLPPTSVLSACVAHTDGNNFLQLLEQVGEACSLPCEGASHSRSPSPSGCREPFPVTLTPPQLQFSSRASLCGWGLALENPVFLCPPLICSPVSSVLVLPSDGNVLVNCITNLLCVYVCLWGWFIIFAGH